jgi:hypothetical protein
MPSQPLRVLVELNRTMRLGSHKSGHPVPRLRDRIEFRYYKNDVDQKSYCQTVRKVPIGKVLTVEQLPR